MSTRQLDMHDGRHFIVRKALDSTEADRRQSLRSGTVGLEQQAIGWEFVDQVAGRQFENPRDLQFIGRHLGAAARMGAIYTSATGTSEVMNRVTDLPVMAEDEWRQTGSGLWVQTNSIIDAATKGSHELAFRHMNSMDSPNRKRRIGRTFGTVATHLFNLGQPIPAGTPFEVQRAVRERVMDAEFDARQMAHEIGQYPSVTAFADIDSPQSSWLRRNAPSQEVYSAIAQAQEELRQSN